MIHTVTVIADPGTDPNSPEAINAANDAAAKIATAWTQPTHHDTTANGDTITIRYTIDAVPKPAAAVTLDNVHPALRPARVI